MRPFSLPDRIIGDWSLPLLAWQVVKLGVVDSISRETVGRRLRSSAPGTRPPQWYTNYVSEALLSRPQ